MKLLTLLLTFIPLLASGEESYFFKLKKGHPSDLRIEGEQLHFVLPIQKLDPPKATAIMAFHQGLGPGREYQIQVNLETTPEKGWLPRLKLGGEIIMEGISVASPGDPKFASSFSLESDDPKKIKLWCQLLGELLKVPENRIEIDLTKAEQGGAGQPATAPGSKSEGKERPQPASEEHSR